MDTVEVDNRSSIEYTIYATRGTVKKIMMDNISASKYVVANSPFLPLVQLISTPEGDMLSSIPIDSEAVLKSIGGVILDIPFKLFTNTLFCVTDGNSRISFFI